MHRAKNSFPGTIASVIIVAGAIFALSGLCTGMFALEAGQPGSGSYWIQSWHEAVMIGSIALIPSALLLWAAARQARRGNNKISGVIFLIVGIAGLGLCALGLWAGISEFMRAAQWADRSGRFIPVSNIILLIILPITGLLISIWFMIMATKILRYRKPKDISPEIFD